MLKIFSLVRDSCADPESFVRGGPTLTVFFFFFFFGGGGGGGGLMRGGRIKYHYKRAINGLPVKCHLNGVSLVGR